MNYPKGTKLTTGTVKTSSYQYLTYSILIMPYTLNCRPAEFKAEAIIADEEGDLISQFEMDGDEDWALLNACIKRITTEDYAS